MLCVCCVCVCFFLQAGDGIRDLVRSRGLGDVYKRQSHDAGRGGRDRRQAHGGLRPTLVGRSIKALPHHRAGAWAVSYTHLTLPTSDLV